VARSRFSTPLLALALTLAALAALPAAQAQGVVKAASKVLLTQEEGGAAATPGEVSKFSGGVVIAGVECFGTEQNGVMGKNPSGTVKVTGSATPETEIGCSGGDESFKGIVAIKSMTISKTGAEALNLIATARTVAGCTYRLTKLTGTQESGAQTSTTALVGTARLRGSESPKTCAKTAEAKGLQGVSNANFENYTVTFI
jgi:hypothetical protein